MKTTLFCAVWLIGSLASILAADWAEMKKFSAKVKVINMKAETLKEADGKNAWAKVPPRLLESNASIFMPSGSTDGVADYTVTADGWMLIAANYSRQGNSGGDWVKDRWEEKKFKTKGWHLMSKTELGGVLVKGDGRAQEVFAKKVKKGDTERIRCNKYDPPYIILLGEG